MSDDRAVVQPEPGNQQHKPDEEYAVGGAPKGKRTKPLIPGWLTLIVIAAAIFGLGFYLSQDAVPLATVEIETWVCPEQVDPDDSWAQTRQGCEQADAGITMIAGNIQNSLTPEGEIDGSTATLERIPYESVELTIRVQTEPSYSQVLLLRADDDDILRQLNAANVEGSDWSGLWRADGGTEFILVFVPRS